MKLTGLLSWLLLAVALALPALMFWNWRRQIQRKAEPAEAAGGRGTARIFAGGDSSPISKPLPAAATSQAMISSSTGTAALPAAAAPALAPSAPSMAASTASAKAPPDEMVGTSPAPAQPAKPAPMEASAPKAIQRSSDTVGTSPGAAAGGPVVAASSSSTAAAAGVAVSTMVAYAPKSDRDPFISLIEVQMAREAARREELAKLEEERRKREEEAASKRASVQVKKGPVKPAEPPIETRLHVQGIISTPEKKSAIVNNDVVNIGEIVLGAKITQITESAVVFNYKGRSVRVSVPR